MPASEFAPAESAWLHDGNLAPISDRSVGLPLNPMEVLPRALGVLRIQRRDRLPPASIVWDTSGDLPGGFTIARPHHLEGSHGRPGNTPMQSFPMQRQKILYQLPALPAP